MKTVFVIIVASLLGLARAGGGGKGGWGGRGKGGKGGGKKNDFDGYRVGKGSLIPFVYPQHVPVSVPYRVEVPTPYPVPEPYPVFKTVYVPYKVVEKEFVEVVKKVPVEVIKYIPIARNKGAISHTSHSESSYSPPVHSPPSYSSPSYSAPSYSAPTYSAPPSYSAPDHGDHSRSSHSDGFSSSYSSGADRVHSSPRHHTSSDHGGLGVNSIERGSFHPSSLYHDVNGTPVHQSHSFHGGVIHGPESIHVENRFLGTSSGGRGDQTNSINDYSFRLGRSVQVGGQRFSYLPSRG